MEKCPFVHLEKVMKTQVNGVRENRSMQSPHLEKAPRPGHAGLLASMHVPLEGMRCGEQVGCGCPFLMARKRFLTLEPRNSCLPLPIPGEGEKGRP